MFPMTATTTNIPAPTVERRLRYIGRSGVLAVATRPLTAHPYILSTVYSGFHRPRIDWY